MRVCSPWDLQAVQHCEEAFCRLCNITKAVQHCKEAFCRPCSTTKAMRVSSATQTRRTNRRRLLSRVRCSHAAEKVEFGTSIARSGTSRLFSTGNLLVSFAELLSYLLVSLQYASQPPPDYACPSQRILNDLLATAQSMHSVVL